MTRSFAVLLDFKVLGHFLQVNEELILFLSKKLKNIYFINLPNNKVNFKKKKLSKKFKNIQFLEPKNLKEFEKIIRNNKFLIKNNIGTDFQFFKILRILKKYDVPQVVISNIGFLTDSLLISKNDLFNSFIYFFKKIIIHRFYILLTVLKIMPKIDIRFVSSKLQKKYFYDNRKKLINKIFFNQHFSIYKELILVNSRSFDIFNQTKLISKKKLIVFLDIKADHSTNLILDGKIIRKNKDLFYSNLNNFLVWSGKKLKSRLVICTHPYYNLAERKKIYKKFKVFQGKTKEYIKKSNLVIFFQSSAISEAFFLKKNIINLETKIIGKHWEHTSDLYPYYAGIPKINIDTEKSYNKLDLKKIIKKKGKKYFDFRRNFLMPDGLNSGFHKIYKTFKIKYLVN